MSSSKHRGGARGRQTSGDPRRAHASDGAPELDLFTVLTALGTATHADSTPISQEGLYALANALLALAVEEHWEFAGTATLVLHQAIGSARAAAGAPMVVVPVAVADPEVLVELGADPNGPTSLPADRVRARDPGRARPGPALRPRRPRPAAQRRPVRHRQAARAATDPGQRPAAGDPLDEDDHERGEERPGGTGDRAEERAWRRTPRRPGRPRPLRRASTSAARPRTCPSDLSTPALATRR